MVNIGDAYRRAEGSYIAAIKKEEVVVDGKTGKDTLAKKLNEGLSRLSSCRSNSLPVPWRANDDM